MVDTRMIKPPMVGVPFFASCRSGTSSLFSLFNFQSLNFLIRLGVRKKLMTRAVKIARAVLKVIYLKTLKTENVVLRG
ncbi:MAG: hypothetical protein A4E59_03041 [Syntrophorhabdus sp. PtaB.Bin027]|nr:MAG: hypothetical protein A4E59_03041 [Syntrophorhabdus sp. PtaB.Bin027]OQB74515.1 MAG: hypothetical protein BWX92_03009 [Deltaproteobacteria bacterium ADurb.Bin135]